MGRKCLACGHEKRSEIEKAIIGGTPFRRIAARYGMSDVSIRRHLRHCLGEKAVAEVQAKRDITGRELILRKAESLWLEAEGTAIQARADKQNAVVLQSVGARGKILDLEARVRGAYAPIKSEVDLAGELKTGSSEDAKRLIRALVPRLQRRCPDQAEAILRDLGVELEGEK